MLRTIEVRSRRCFDNSERLRQKGRISSRTIARIPEWTVVVAYTYESAVPWGRSFDEYVRMFSLSESDLRGKILGCADGPAGFNARMAELGHHAISCDPLYQFSGLQIGKRIDETYDSIIAQTYSNVESFNWSTIKSVEDLGRVRRAAMDGFLRDYEEGKRDGRYVPAELPDLPFRKRTFDLALCSHFLFLYSPILSLALHQQAIEAMCAVAEEVRIFPLLTYNSDRSPYVKPVMAALRSAGRTTSIERVTYEFQKGGNEMLRIRPQWC
jgi:hypothetical protein